MCIIKLCKGFNKGGVSYEKTNKLIRLLETINNKK